MILVFILFKKIKKLPTFLEFGLCVYIIYIYILFHLIPKNSFVLFDPWQY